MSQFQVLKYLICKKDNQYKFNKQIIILCYYKRSMDDFTFSEPEENYFQDEPQFQSCITSYFQLQDDFSQQKLTISDNKNKQLKDTAESESPETEHLFNIAEEFHKEGLFLYQSRETSRIEVKNKTIKNQYIERKKGHKKQTSQLTINYKNYIKSFLQEYSLSYQISREEKQLISQFISNDSNLSNFRKLFGVEENHQIKKSNQQVFVMVKADGIRDACLKYLSQSSAGLKVLRNNKMNFSNKVTMLKFIQVLRKGCVHPQQMFGWKTE